MINTETEIVVEAVAELTKRTLRRVSIAVSRSNVSQAKFEAQRLTEELQVLQTFSDSLY